MPGKSLSNRHRTARLALLVYLCPAFAAAVYAGRERVEQAVLFPQLHAGQVLVYQIGYHTDKHVETQGPLTLGSAPRSISTDVNALLRLEVLAVEAHGERASVRARTHLKILNSDTPFDLSAPQLPSDQLRQQESANQFVEFTFLPDGHIEGTRGLDALTPQQQEAWQEWASRFLMAATFPPARVRISQKWHSVEMEQAPSLLAGLRWVRESLYAHNEPCRPLQLSSQTEAPSDAPSAKCAVILTTATLSQLSRKDSTPEDFKLHALRTTGTAAGKNRILTYIGSNTGFLVRATQESDQQMDVTVTMSDGSNRVHYSVKAKSRSEVLLVSETATPAD